MMKTMSLTGLRDGSKTCADICAPNAVNINILRSSELQQLSKEQINEINSHYIEKNSS